MAVGRVAGEPPEHDLEPFRGQRLPLLGRMPQAEAALQDDARALEAAQQPVELADAGIQPRRQIEFQVALDADASGLPVRIVVEEGQPAHMDELPGQQIDQRVEIVVIRKLKRMAGDEFERLQGQLTADGRIEDQIRALIAQEPIQPVDDRV